MNETQTKLLKTAMVQISHASSNVSEAVHIEGLRDPQVDEVWMELNMAWKRLWNTLHDGGPFRVASPYLHSGKQPVA